MELRSLAAYRGKTVCAALSGGRDSVALLHSLLHAAPRWGISVRALTCEHGIRGEESLRDLSFCEGLCRDWGVPLRIYRADVPARAKRAHRGLEEEARLFRYACFARAVAEGWADVVATAHHRDDAAETVLFRLARGTSPAGMNVFPPRAGVIRPFLDVTRAEIDEYIAANALPYVEDGSNADVTYTRNALRRLVMPPLERAVPGAAEHLVKFAVLAAEDDAFLTALAEEKVAFCGEEACIPLFLPRPLFSRAVLCAVKKLGAERDYTAANAAEAARLQALQSGRRVCLPQGLEAFREGETLVIGKPVPPFAGEIAFSLGDFPEAALFAGEGKRAGALSFDVDALPSGCVIRTRREGDVFTPYRGKERTLKKFFSDRKIPARLGNRLPLVARGSVVLAVCGAEICDSIKVTSDTVRLGYLYTPLRMPAGTSHHGG